MGPCFHTLAATFFGTFVPQESTIRTQLQTAKRRTATIVWSGNTAQELVRANALLVRKGHTPAALGSSIVRCVHRANMGTTARAKRPRPFAKPARPVSTAPEGARASLVMRVVMPVEPQAKHHHLLARCVKSASTVPEEVIV